jgi:hypothetical protein
MSVCLMRPCVSLHADEGLAVRGFDDLLYLMVKTAEDLPLLGCPLAHPIAPAIWARDRELGRIPDLHRLVEQMDRGLRILGFQVDPQTAHDLHVLVRHRLLPQTGGSEGLVASLVGGKADSPSGVHRPEMKCLGFDLSPACRTLAGGADMGENVLA